MDYIYGRLNENYYCPRRICGAFRKNLPETLYSVSQKKGTKKQFNLLSFNRNYCINNDELRNTEGQKKGKRDINNMKQTLRGAVTIPNCISISRIVATPYICYLMYIENYKVAIAAFWIAGFLDFVDGYIARNWGQKSIVGSFLDPLADKFFVCSTLVVLAVKGLIPLYCFGIIVSRDLLLLGGSLYIRAVTKPASANFFEIGEGARVNAVEASTLSKFNALFQFGLIWFTMTSEAFEFPAQENLYLLHGIVCFSTLTSGFDYWYRSHWKSIFLKK